MTKQHPTAVIDSGAVLGKNTTIGPHAVIDENVVVGDDCSIGPHVYLTGHTSIGSGTKIHAGAVIGDMPQDLHYGGETTYTEIGAGCTIREYVTIHRGSSPGSKTVVGESTMLMAFVHLGHNCEIGDHVVIANNSILAGHVTVKNRAFLSGAVLVHQFVRIGRIAMIGGDNAVIQDVPPFCMLQADQIQGPNVIGLQRSGLETSLRRAVRWAVKTYFFGGLNRPNALAEITAKHGDIPEVQEFVSFIEETQRGITTGRGVKGPRV